jgi:hypothetical protein
MTARRPDRVHLYRMPATQLLAALPPGSIDLLITDPPYVTVDRGNGSGHLRDWFKNGLTWREIGVVLAAARRKMKPTGVAFVMTNGAGLREALAALERARLRAGPDDRLGPAVSGPRERAAVTRSSSSSSGACLVPGSLSAWISSRSQRSVRGPGTATQLRSPRGSDSPSPGWPGSGQASSSWIHSAEAAHSWPGRSGAGRRSSAATSRPGRSRERASGSSGAPCA